MANTNRQQVAADVTTVDATATTVVTYPIPNNATCVLHGIIVARQPGGTSKCWEGVALVKNVNGILTLIGNALLFTAIGDVGAAAWAMTITTSGSNFAVNVTGAAATTVNWSVQADIVTVKD